MNTPQYRKCICGCGLLITPKEYETHRKRFTPNPQSRWVAIESMDGQGLIVIDTEAIKKAEF